MNIYIYIYIYISVRVRVIYLHIYIYTYMHMNIGVDPFDELLLGPTFACHKVLDKMNLKLQDIGVIEFHEAFAGQVLANMTAMGSEKVCIYAYNYLCIYTCICIM
jgi:hypothetical protein